MKASETLMNSANRRLGECKTPGGKLAAAEIELDGGFIVQARIHGDFFIHPEPEAEHILTTLAASLVGAPENLDPAAIAARLRAALPFGVELLGTSPDAIAEAVRRAMTTSNREVAPLERIGAFTEYEIANWTHRWTTLNWRLIPETPLPPAMNVALDEVLTNRVAAGQCPPTLRFWKWSAPAVIVGRCQSIRNEVDLDAATAKGIQIVRRMTGGGAMFLQPHGAITYSLYIPETSLTGLSIRQSYEVCDSWVIQCLREIGVDAHHVPINDIACGAGKIGGAAQARRSGVVLHHTTLAYDMDPGEMVSVLRIGREKLSDKAVASASKRVSPLISQTGLPRDEIVKRLFNHFQNRFGGTLSTLSDVEMNTAAELMTNKYTDNEWLKAFE
ncbi:biotin/lipoate A/B protein ligase family protein [soil metagenome]